MVHVGKHSTRLLFGLALGMLVGGAFVASGGPQDRHVAQSAGVDNTKMGPYRALAQLAYAEFEKGDAGKAAQLAHILERVWDKSEDYGGDTALSKTSPDQFKQIDAAMDEFIEPIMGYAKKAPDKLKVKSAYTAYLEKLKLAD